jgi:hypothetical protein
MVEDENPITKEPKIDPQDTVSIDLNKIHQNEVKYKEASYRQIPDSLVFDPDMDIANLAGQTLEHIGLLTNVTYTAEEFYARLTQENSPYLTLVANLNLDGTITYAHDPVKKGLEKGTDLLKLLLGKSLPTDQTVPSDIARQFENNFGQIYITSNKDRRDVEDYLKEKGVDITQLNGKVTVIELPDLVDVLKNANETRRLGQTTRPRSITG